MHMKDFRLYDITDFVLDEDFIRWVHGKSYADNAFWNNWLIQNPSMHLVLAEAKQIVECIKLEQKTIEPREVKTEIDKVLKAIRHQEKRSKPASRLAFFHEYGWRAAAAIFLLGVAGILFLSSQKENNNRLEKFAYARIAASSSFTERSNGSDQTVPLTLPDGSTVQLGAKSRISYSNSFNTSASRDIYLSGEAFFKIAKNPGHPFRVFSNEIVTKVLGTSFSVRCYEKDTTISVTVRTGKVSVCSQVNTSDKGPILAVKPAGIIVTPNQQLTYQRFDQKFQKMLIESPLFIVPDASATDHNMAYEDKPVEQVFDQLGKYYGINMVYDNDLLSKCTVTADLSNEPFYHKLDLICKAIGAKYELLDGQVVIQSNGCQ
jgi:transmembrane sensor